MAIFVMQTVMESLNLLKWIVAHPIQVLNLKPSVTIETLFKGKEFSPIHKYKS